MGTLIREAVPLRIPDMERDPRRHGFPVNHPAMKSLLGVPVLYKGRAVGDLYLTDKVGSEEFTEEDQHLLMLLASHAAVAIENARLYGEVLTLNETLEARVEERGHALAARESERALLVGQTEMLYNSLDPEAALEALARLVVPRIADWCSIVLLEGTSIRTVAVTHRDPAKVSWARGLEQTFSYDPGAPLGFAAVLRTGESQLIERIDDQMIHKNITDPELREHVKSLGFRSSMVVPLRARGRLLGGLAMVSAESGRYYDESDLELAEEIAGRAALHLDNARLYRELQGTAHDLERRVAERTVRLAAANKELESFAYSVSHDLRAPLRHLDGFSRVLLDRYSDRLDEQGHRYLNHVRDAAQEMGDLIDGLLRLARITRSEMRWESVDLSDLVRTAGATFLEAEPEREVHLTVATDAVAMGDSQLLRSLVENLLANAWKFTRSSSPAQIEFGTDGQGDEHVYAIRDNGAGFDMQYADKLFGPFQRLHSASEFEGTGIGLATVQRIVHRHGGRVWAEGTVGEGATFYFTLASQQGTTE